MTMDAGLRFVRRFLDNVEGTSEVVDVVLCPPCTALHPIAQALAGSSVEVGAQNLSSAEGKAHTGQISPELVVDAGGRWVLLGHWEIRRRTGEGDADVNEKLRAARDASLRSIVLIGEGADERDQPGEALDRRLDVLLAGMEPSDVTASVIVYEPEWTIGADEPAPPERVAAGCRVIREWVTATYGGATGAEVRIIYGGSVTPERAEALLASPEVDGLGAGRKGRDPDAFAEIVRLIAQAKGVR
jgi:triosephosphate isomerase